jgi:class 3 adenylate cyclase/tetratricopeptide (TPR) repeat protein
MMTELVTSEALCSSCAAPSPVGARFCITCGIRLQVDGGERRRVSVLFADLRGFAASTAVQDAASVRALADRATARMQRIVEQHGGVVDKVISEGGFKLMALFGAPVAHEDDPQRCVTAALAMQAAAREAPDDFGGFSLAIGVMSGEAIYGPIGAGGASTVLGDTVNTAARLQSAAMPGEILIGRATRDAVHTVLAVEEVAPIAAKGKNEPVPAWRATGVALARRRARTRAPLIGRDVELAALEAHWERMLETERAHLATVVGVPGIGKSHLVAAFLERASRGRVLKSRCARYGEGMTYWPVTEMIGIAAGMSPDDDPATISRKLGILLEGLGIDDRDQLRTIAVAVANLVAVPTTPRGTYRAESISRAELHWGVRRLFQLLARNEPLVLVIEDLHAAEAGLLDLLASIAEGDARCRLFAIGIARRELLDQAPPLLDPAQNRRLVDVPPLGQAPAAELLHRLIGQTPAEAALLDAAQGNPLFLEEIVRLAQDDPDLIRFGSVPVPDSVGALIEARLDRLDETERRLATHAAVIGSTFWLGALAAIEGMDEHDLVAGLRALAEHDVIDERPVSSIADESEYAFRQSMVRDVAYARVPKLERAALHERCGEWLAGLGGGAALTEFVAYHLEQACRLAADVDVPHVRAPTIRAVQALRTAGERAEAREGVQEADRFYERALDIVGTRLPETATELSFRRARTRTVLGALDEATVLFEEGARAADQLKRTDLVCEALLRLSELDLARGTLDDGKRRALEATRLATALDEPSLVARTAFRTSQLAQIDGDLDGAVAALEEALVIAGRIGDEGLLEQGELRLGTLLFNLGQFGRAERHFEYILARADATGLINLAIATAASAFVKFYCGPRQEARALAMQALAWFERAPHTQMQIQTVHLLSMLDAAACSPGDRAVAQGGRHARDRRLPPPGRRAGHGGCAGRGEGGARLDPRAGHAPPIRPRVARADRGVARRCAWRPRRRPRAFRDGDRSARRARRSRGPVHRSARLRPCASIGRGPRGRARAVGPGAGDLRRPRRARDARRDRRSGVTRRRGGSRRPFVEPLCQLIELLTVTVAGASIGPTDGLLPSVPVATNVIVVPSLSPDASRNWLTTERTPSTVPMPNWHSTLPPLRLQVESSATAVVPAGIGIEMRMSDSGALLMFCAVTRNDTSPFDGASVAFANSACGLGESRRTSPSRLIGCPACVLHCDGVHT